MIHFLVILIFTAFNRDCNYEKVTESFIFSFLSAKVRKPWQSGQYTVYLWEFLFGLLQDPECCSLITWTNKESKEFRIKNTHEIATLWGTVKNRPTMDDKKLLRALRYYYKTKVLRKVRRILIIFIILCFISNRSPLCKHCPTFTDQVRPIKKRLENRLCRHSKTG